MKVDTKKFFAAFFVFCATVIAIAVHDYRQADNLIFETAAKALILFLGALPFMLLYRNILAKQVHVLSSEMDFTNEKLYETTNLLEEKIEEKTKELIDEGFQDPLTHLANRHRLIFDMDRYAYRTLIIIHLQNLRELRHFFGNTIGDSLLQQFALWLERMNYNPYRLGNTEFALLLAEEYSSTKITAYCEELFHKLSKHPFISGFENVSLEIHMGVHIGDNLSLAHADSALQSAIETSKTFAVYQPHSDLEMQQQHNIKTAKEIREAFHTGRIICYYQPIISTLSGNIEKYETLARLISTDGTIVSPHDFLDIAQKTRLYSQISQEVIHLACEAFRDRNENFTIHLCALDIVDHSTIRYIEETIATTNTTSRIIFELSEDDIYQHYLPASLFIQHMKRLGVQIAIDNFGSSYSNFEKIIHLDVDYLKIDGSLISKTMHSQHYVQIIKSISSFANTIGAKSIAENVESAEILEHIKDIGIDFAQGYHIGKPGPSSLKTL